jgi:hypothetical protein
VGAERDAVANRLDDRGMRVALHHRPERVVQIDQLVAVDIPHTRSLSVREIDRPGVAFLVGGWDASHERRAGAFEERA